MATRKAARATKKAKKPASRGKAASAAKTSARKSSAKPKGGARRAAARRGTAKATKKVAAKKAMPKKAVAKKTAKPARRAQAPKRGAVKAKKTAATTAAVRPAVRSLGAKKPVTATRPRARAMAPRPKSAGQPPEAQRRAPALNRARRVIQDDDEIITSPPSTLDMDRTASSARSGRQAFAHKLHDHNETGPAMTGGDLDADWESAYSVGDEAPGGDNPTPDQDIVDDIGRALGNEYQDNEPLKGADKIIERDKHRWELDPGSKEDFDDRD